ncbi:hypothetical protein [Klebsiella pneumoniae]|uniref:hypothetical protein n=1 Tax=Klebsiella pneumoniae TaxID=573 RepID=UPI00202DEBF7|nr:hypothetical protein [Klebsiella pneumoniae]URU47173.1 hypothetical protein NBY30_25475 [Klebsiella pneumoniae]
MRYSKAGQQLGHRLDDPQPPEIPASATTPSLFNPATGGNKGSERHLLSGYR